ncbi:unnamed protein product [Pseudo-nitzschia multistriata]|uniref:acireductone dioxygenase (Fe(2+)-requiring) n=1 Tax=Pseudo-nitzschia multistriata TaxID=183589 RepID=A0A448ZAA1_9STRA|nr:unnamed protein product [Pseudo-nitzschia multistriata]
MHTLQRHDASPFRALRVLFYAGMAALAMSAVAVVDAARGNDCSPGVPLPANFDGAEWPELVRVRPEDEATLYDGGDNSTTANATNAILVEPAVLASAGVAYRYTDPARFENATSNITSSIALPDAVIQQLSLALDEKSDDPDPYYKHANVVLATEFADEFWDEHSMEANTNANANANAPAAKTAKYVLDGSGILDVRDLEDEWVRIHLSPGDWFELPAGIQRRFSVDDEDSYLLVVDLSASSEPKRIPRWPEAAAGEKIDNTGARNSYVDAYLCGVDPDGSTSTSTSTTGGSLWNDGLCSSHSTCAGLDLDGDCCPTAEGIFLDCCGAYIRSEGTLARGGNGSGRLLWASLLAGGVAAAIAL